MEENKFFVGEQFKDQIKRVTNPHRYEGNMYEESGGDKWMFCQIKFVQFGFICLATGNRVFSIKNNKKLSGYGKLKKIAKHVDNYGDALRYIKNPFANDQKPVSKWELT